MLAAAARPRSGPRLHGKLLAALREDRAALLHALCERDAARAEAVALRAELVAERASRDVVAVDTVVVGQPADQRAAA